MTGVKVINKEVFAHCDLVKMKSTQFSETNTTGAATLQRGKNRFRGFTLDKSIHLYRMWFQFVKIIYDAEQSKLTFGAQQQHKVKLNKRFYKDWEFEKYIDASFDDFFADKIHLFGEEAVSIVDEIDETDGHIYLKVRKHKKTEDVVREVRELLSNVKHKSDLKYQIQRQHKYFYLHQQYNVFLMRQSGWLNYEIKDWLLVNYGKYRARVVSTDAAMRKMYRSSEQNILDVAKGDF
jgi:hypothetical protein